MGTVYLLHFDRPISDRHTTQHYLGYADNLEDRLERHRAGDGSRLCAVAKERDIQFVLVRTWTGDKKLERSLKNRKNGKRLCPICRKEE